MTLSTLGNSVECEYLNNNNREKVCDSGWACEHHTCSEHHAVHTNTASQGHIVVALWQDEF